MSNQPPLGEQISGAEPPRSFIMDASIMDFQEEHQIVREDIKQNRVVFEFPSGVNKLDLLEECRALTMLEDFDMMFDITMQMLVDKDLIIYIRNEGGHPVQMASLHVTDRYQNLRGDNFIDEYPVVVTWLVEFMGAKLSKKYPMPGIAQSAPPQTSKDQSRTKKAVYKVQPGSK
jgi:hypothetical protein